MGKFRLWKRSGEMCIGHRLIGYPGKCQNIHGHGVVLEIELWAPFKNNVGMAGADFDDLKRVLNEIDGYWDHGFLVHFADEEMIQFCVNQKSKWWSCPLGNPTMENLAEFAFNYSYAAGLMVYATRIFEKGGLDNVAEYRK